MLTEAALQRDETEGRVSDESLTQKLSANIVSRAEQQNVGSLCFMQTTDTFRFAHRAHHIDKSTICVT